MKSNNELVQDILVRLYNDISNRQSQQILFDDGMNIMEAYREIMKIIHSVQEDNKAADN